jgi:hypothetical protein
MKKLTVLEIVQDILNDFTSDEVNSINDTLEAMQVAQAVQTTYAHIIDGRDWPHLYKLFQITGWADEDFPTYCTIPENTVEVLWLKYDKKKVTYKTPEEFMELVDVRDPTETNVTTITDSSGIDIYVLNNQAPTYWTSFDEKTIVFDAFDSDVEDTIMTSKTQAYGKILPVFTLADSFVPDLPAQAFSYLLAESKAHAATVLQQAPNPKAQEYSITQRRRMSQEAWKVQGGITVPSYGRK